MNAIEVTFRFFGGADDPAKAITETKKMLLERAV